MIGVPSSPYNDLDIQLYGGRSGLKGALRKVRKAWSYTPVGRLSPVLKKAWSYTPVGRLARSLGRLSGTKRIRGGGLYETDTGEVVGGGWGDYGDELFGGRTRRRRRRATAKQLRALAKGRAKLKALRRLRGGTVRRRYRSKSRGEDYGPTARMGSHPRYSQEGLDRAALEVIRIWNRLKNEYGWGTSDPVTGPTIYPIAQRLNNLYNYIQRCNRLGYDESYPLPDIPNNLWESLRGFQRSNNMSRALRRDGPHTMRSVVRKILQDQGQPSDPASVNAAIRKGRIGIYDAEMSLPGYDPNVF